MGLKWKGYHVDRNQRGAIRTIQGKERVLELGRRSENGKEKPPATHTMEGLRLLGGRSKAI